MSERTKNHANHCSNKMDPKHRVSIPVELRPQEEGSPLCLQLSKEHKMPIIKVYEVDVFEDKFRQIEEASMAEAKKNVLIGHLRMMSKKAFVSSQGKLTIPKGWAEKVGIKPEGMVRIGGRGAHFMLCSEETFNLINEIEFNMDDDDLGVL